jgi:hypothetical protein
MIKSSFLRTIQNLSTNIPLRVITITYPVADTAKLNRSIGMLSLTSHFASDAARFVTGVVVPVDGGFSAYSGV